jgi:hypothetical protein
MDEQHIFDKKPTVGTMSPLKYFVTNIRTIGIFYKKNLYNGDNWGQLCPLKYGVIKPMQQ